MGTGGRYLQPEPLQSWRPKSAASAAYAYGGNNPIANTDRTGLYKRSGDIRTKCPNWEPALYKAKEMAGCHGVCDQKAAECREKISKCGGCNICPLLEEGAGPWAVMSDLDNWLRVLAYGGLNDAVSNRLTYTAVFDDELCTDSLFEDELAAKMVHEALHLCGAPSFSAPAIRDDASECSAESVERSCQRAY